MVHRFAFAALVVALASPAPAQTARSSGEPPYAAQVSCHYSMGGRFENGAAVLPGRLDGVSGRFVFTGTAYSFQAADGRRSDPGVLRSLNEALVQRARAVESADPGSYNASRCPELVPAAVPGDY
jgi:hypothetical protein